MRLFVALCMMQNKHIPNYQLSNSLVMDASTGEIVHPVNNQYILKTSEEVFLETTGKTIKLVRRFSPEQIQKLYESGTPVTENVTDVTMLQAIPKKVLQDSKMLQDVTGQQYLINGVTYNTLREAANVTGTSHMTLKRWIDAGKEGYSKV